MALARLSHPPARKRLVAVAVAVAALALIASLTGCAGVPAAAPTASSTAASSTTATPPSSAATTARSAGAVTPAPTAQPSDPSGPSGRPRAASGAPTPSSTAGASAVDRGRAAAVGACATWARAQSLSSADAWPVHQEAAQQSARAAELDPRWASLNDDVAFLASLPNTGNTDEDIARAQQAEPAVEQTCLGLGVHVPH